MRVRRIGYTTDGERRLSAKWYGVFVDWSGALRRLPLFKDRKASESAARLVDRLNTIRATGDTMPPELARFVETMPATTRRTLVRWGILTADRGAAGKPLRDHLADWKAALMAKGNTARYVDQLVERATAAFAACRFRFWTDVSASKLQRHLADLRRDDGDKRGISAQTHNFYLQACRQFARWMVRDGRAMDNPLAHLSGVNVRMDRRHDRRALSVDELRILLAVTTEAPERYKMTGPERAALYRLTAETGLRPGETRSLTASSFQLVGDPSVTVAAGYSKRRREDVQPLRPETVAMMRRLEPCTVVRKSVTRAVKVDALNSCSA